MKFIKFFMTTAVTRPDDGHHVHDILSETPVPSESGARIPRHPWRARLIAAMVEAGESAGYILDPERIPAELEPFKDRLSENFFEV